LTSFSGPIQWARGDVGLKPSAAARPDHLKVYVFASLVLSVSAHRLKSPRPPQLRQGSLLHFWLIFDVFFWVGRGFVIDFKNITKHLIVVDLTQAESADQPRTSSRLDLG